MWVLLTEVVALSLAHGGIWTGGEPGRATLQWTPTTAAPATQGEWSLAAGGAVLAEGRFDLPAGWVNHEIEIATPAVRARLEAALQVKILLSGEMSKLTQSAVLHLPPQLRVPGPPPASPLALVGTNSSLGDFLESRKIPYRKVTAAQLSTVVGNVIWVDSELPGGLHAIDAALLERAREGAVVVTFRHPPSDRFAGLRWIEPPPGTRLRNRFPHPLLDQIVPSDWDRWLAANAAIAGIELGENPASGAVDFIIEPPATTRKTTLTVLGDQRVGAGRIVYCGLPLRFTASDATTTCLLVRILEYSLSPPAITPIRDPAKQPAESERPAINIGATPGD